MILSVTDNKNYEISSFIDEKELQDYLASSPQLLNPICKINKQDYPLCIISKEFSVKSGYLDFLCADIEGGLYIIETKLANNPEIRRAVIGQLVEYASNLNDMSYDDVDKECRKYFTKDISLEMHIYNYYTGLLSEEDIDIYSAENYKSAIERNLGEGRFNFVIAANNVNFEIQRLFSYFDEITKENINFIVLEINKYYIDSKVYIHSNVVWAAKYIKSLFSRTAIKEDDYMNSLPKKIQELVRKINKKCIGKGLTKSSTTRGISWKSDKGGSIYVTGDRISTNFSTIKDTSESFNKFKKVVLRKVQEAGFTIKKSSKYGSFSLKLGESADFSKIDIFIDYAYSILEKVS